MQYNIETKDEYTFADLVDVDAFGQLLDNFAIATGVPNGMVTEEGVVISKAHWLNACELFHRANAESNKCCVESNISLMKSLGDKTIACDLCKNGLIDYATPIVIEGRRLATLFLGQVLSEEPDLEFFKEQAKKYGYDEEKYIESIKAVPVVSEERMESLMKCVVGIANVLAASGLARLRQNVLEHNLNQTTQRRIQIEDILNFSPIGIGWSDSNGNIEYVNKQFTALFGYTIEDIPTLKAWYQKAFPNEEYRNYVNEYWKKAEIDFKRGNKQLPSLALEVDVTCKNGNQRHVIIRISWVGDKRLVSFSDMSAHWKSEQRNKAHDAMLEMVARGTSFSDILLSIVRTIESEDPDSMCSILLLDRQGKRLLTGAAPSLPEFYNNAINGVEIGMGVGSCGTAAFIGKRVIVDDISTHEYWAPYASLAQSAGLRACWSEPIIASDGKVLGTFAIYHPYPTKPKKADTERISFAANLAAIAIENKKAREELEYRAYTDYLTGLANRRYFFELAEMELSRLRRHGGNFSLAMFDIDHFKQINDTYGHAVGDMVLQEMSRVCGDTLRDIDVIGRIGGEEFAVILPHTKADDSLAALERLRLNISQIRVGTEDGRTVNFTASFGLVPDCGGDDGIDVLLSMADSALYAAKQEGRNRIRVYGVNIAN